MNQHRLRSNRKGEEPQPVVTVKCRLDGKAANVYGYTVEILGPSRVVYRPEKALSCGAVLWVETRAEVVVSDREA